MFEEIIYSNHARERMYQRDITEEIVKLVITKPDFIKHIAQEKQITKKKIDDGIRTVIFIKKEKFIKIITVY